MIHAKDLPQAGQRIGRICGPGEFASDDAGIVLCQVDDRWGSHVVVLMDNGTTETCHGMNRGPGIGWHYL